LTEYQIQKELLEWCRDNAIRYPGLDRIIHIPNEGKRKGKQIGGFKAMSKFNKGVPDLFLPVPLHDYHGLWIELKTPRGKVSDDQMNWLCFFSGFGYRATVCRGLEAAQTEIIGYYMGVL